MIKKINGNTYLLIEPTTQNILVASLMFNHYIKATTITKFLAAIGQRGRRKSKPN